MKWETRSCEGPPKRSASGALSSPVANVYAFSHRPQASYCAPRPPAGTPRPPRGATPCVSRSSALSSRLSPLFRCPDFTGRLIPSFAQQSGGQIGREAAGRQSARDVKTERAQAHWTHRALLSRGSGLAHGAHLAAAAAAAVEDAGAVGLEPAHDDAG